MKLQNLAHSFGFSEEDTRDDYRRMQSDVSFNRVSRWPNAGQKSKEDLKKSYW